MVDYAKQSRNDLIRLPHEQVVFNAGETRPTYPVQTPPWQIIPQLKPRSQPTMVAVAQALDAR